jgi:CelD/BcsL family acetyltransferase involved in cellulose biosynthesis
MRPHSQFRPWGITFAEEAMRQSVRALHSHDHRFMYVERISTWPQLAAIGAEWNTLAGDMPFRTWDWLATWWKHYGCQPNGGRELYVLAIYADANGHVNDGARKLVGIAPWYVDRTVIQGNVLRWLGSGEICTDHLSLICHPENAEQVASAMAVALNSEYDDWNRLDLSGVDADDAAIEKLTEALAARNCDISKQPSDSCWVLDLPTSWDEYLAGISKSHRKQLRQLERRVLESNRVVWHRVESAEDLGVAWNVLVDLHQRRRQSLGEPGCFASHRFYAFHREVVELLLACGQLRISWMELDGTPAAAEYHLAGADVTYAYQGGVDPARLDEEPGRLSTILCLRRAIEEGHRQLDFLRGDEPYKAHWRATPRATYEYRVVPNRRLARLRGRVRSAADTIGDWARHGVQRLRNSQMKHTTNENLSSAT